MPYRDDPGFQLDRRIAWDSEHVLWLELCELRLMNDCRWPWLLLIPQRPGLEELHEMEPLDRSMLSVESTFAAITLKATTGCQKINMASLGNAVRQLHVHVIARSEGDPNWPGPVWDHGERQPYEAEKLEEVISKLRTAFDQVSIPASEEE